MLFRSTPFEQLAIFFVVHAPPAIQFYLDLYLGQTAAGKKFFLSILRFQQREERLGDPVSVSLSLCTENLGCAKQSRPVAVVRVKYIRRISCQRQAQKASLLCEADRDRNAIIFASFEQFFLQARKAFFRPIAFAQAVIEARSCAEQGRGDTVYIGIGNEEQAHHTIRVVAEGVQ